MYGNLYHINFHRNFCYGAGPSLDHTFTAQANSDPGTVYIHHNVIDTTTRLVFWGRYGRDDAGVRESIALSAHGAHLAEKILYLSTLRLQVPLNAEPIPTNNQPIMDCMIQRQPRSAKYPANAIQHCRWNLRSRTNLYDD